MSTKINVHAEVTVPKVPNFLRIEGYEQTISIADVTDESLRGLGAEWTENLVQRAAEIRKQRLVPDDPENIELARRLGA